MSQTFQSISTQVLSLNKVDSPFVVKIEGNKIIGNWNILDAKWLGLLSANKAKKDYFITFDLDEKSYQYSYVEKSTESESNLSSSSFGTGMRFFKGKELFNKQMGITIGLGMKNKNKPVEAMGAASYNFDNHKIKDPIVKILNNAGWSEKKGFFGKLFN